MVARRIALSKKVDPAYKVSRNIYFVFYYF